MNTKVHVLQRLANYSPPETCGVFGSVEAAMAAIEAIIATDGPELSAGDRYRIVPMPLLVSGEGFDPHHWDSPAEYISVDEDGVMHRD